MLPSNVTAIGPEAERFVILPKPGEFYVETNEFLKAEDLQRGMILHRARTGYLVQIIRGPYGSPYMAESFIQRCSLTSISRRQRPPGQIRDLKVTAYNRELLAGNIIVIAKIVTLKSWAKSTKLIEAGAR